MRNSAVLIALALSAACAAGITACGGEDAQPGADGGDVDATAPTTDGDAADATTDSTTPRDAGADAKADARDAATDARDAGVDARDASEGGAVDAAPDVVTYPDPGTPCPTDQQVQSRLCGYCGTESRLCARTGDGGLAWQPWGACRGEILADAGCLPGTTRAIPCGLCGSQPQTCSTQCQWQSGFCNQPATSVCAPDSGQYVAGLSCEAGGRIRYCEQTCTYGGFSDCFDPSSVDGGSGGGATNIATTTASGANKVTLTRSMPSGSTLDRLGAFSECPNASITPSTPRAFDDVVIRNPDSARTATVSIWTFPAPSGPPDIDNIIAAYENRATPPATPAERMACSKGVRDGCDGTAVGDPTACTSSWAGLIDESGGFGTDDRVILGPGQSAVIHVEGYFATDLGDYQISIRTDVLQ